MSIRETTRQASEKETFTQRAATYHQHRESAITDGDHALTSDPHAIIHAIPEGAFKASQSALADVDDVDDVDVYSLTGFTEEGTQATRTTTGRRVHPVEEELESYNELSDRGIVEAVSNRFMNETDGQQAYDGKALEAATTALAYWASTQYEKLNVEKFRLHVTLTGLSDAGLHVGERAAQSREDEYHEFGSAEARPFGIEIETGQPDHMQETYEQLWPLFDSLWAVADQLSSPYHQTRVPRRYVVNQAKRFQ